MHTGIVPKVAEVRFVELEFMNFKADEETLLTSPNLIKSLQTPSVNTEVAHEKKTFHVTLNVQKVFG